MRIKFTGTIAGLAFSIGSFLATYTMIIPMICILPCAALESFFVSILGNEPYTRVAKAVLWTYLAVLILACLVFYLKILKQKQQSGKSALRLYILFFLVIFFIVHGLGFYIYWGYHLDFKSDGQLFFLVYETFPYSSMAFLLIGILGDLICPAQL